MVGMAVATTVDSIDARNRLSMMPAVTRIIRLRDIRSFQLPLSLGIPAIILQIHEGLASRKNRGVSKIQELTRHCEEARARRLRTPRSGSPVRQQSLWREMGLVRPDRLAMTEGCAF